MFLPAKNRQVSIGVNIKPILGLLNVVSKLPRLLMSFEKPLVFSGLLLAAYASYSNIIISKSIKSKLSVH